MCCLLFCSSRRLHTSCALVTGVQTCALPIYVESWRVRLDGIAHDYIATERPAGDADALIKRALSDATTPKPELKLNLRLDPQLATPGTYKAKVATAPATLPPLPLESAPTRFNGPYERTVALQARVGNMREQLTTPGKNGRRASREG